MRDIKLVKQELKRLGADKSTFGGPERGELPKILMSDEEIQHIINGRYSGGFATLVATNQRLLLVDKKIFFLTVEDIRYDMIAEVDYGHQFIGATIHVRSFSKDLKFQSFKKDDLREFTHFIQHRVMALRGQQMDENNPAKISSNKARDPVILSARDDEPVPIHAYNIDVNADGFGDDLSNEQVKAVLPLDKELWKKVTKARKLVNPYAQTPLTTRRRIGRFNYASKY